MTIDVDQQNSRTLKRFRAQEKRELERVLDEASGTAHPVSRGIPWADCDPDEDR